MSNFITNSRENNLRKRIIELIIKSKELKFLVAFFYFSGIRELYKSLKKNKEVKIKVLVGLDVDKLNFNLVEVAFNRNISNEEKISNFFLSVQKSINSDSFDNQEFYEQVQFFVDLIKKGRLIIRRTLYPNHSKLYIFKLEKGQVGRNKLLITGSSNLTKSGLERQDEFNVEISDYGIDEAEEYFDTLWERGLKITENDTWREKLIDIIENKTLIKKISPFEAFVLVLKIYLDEYKGKNVSEYLCQLMENNGYIPYKYQVDAIRQALAIIGEYKGIILADVVGLGKTIMACAVARELRKRGVIICPPGIMGDPRKKDSGWNMYIEQFGLYDWEVWSLGELEKLQERIRRARDIEIVIVDEAHRFRNEDTKNYEYLKNICRNKIVILLTATPFNNRPKDILSLVKLFIPTKKSNITLNDNLADKFKYFAGLFDKLSFITKNYKSSDKIKLQKVNTDYKKIFREAFDFINPRNSLVKIKRKTQYLASQIRDVIEPVTIRRNRLDLQEHPEYRKEIKKLSKIADPIEWFYALTKEQSEFYDKVIKKYFVAPDEGGKFKGAIYRPFEYETSPEKVQKGDLTLKENRAFLQQRNLYDFMRRLLVKRFESSFGAFEQSINNFFRITYIVEEFIKKTHKYILDRDLIEKIYSEDEDVIEGYLSQYAEKIRNGEYPKNYKVYEVEKFSQKEKFLSDIKSDLFLFKKILSSLKFLNLVNNDPKLRCLVEEIGKQLEKEPQRKIIIFSEYLDTVKYLEPRLKKVFGDKLLAVYGNLSQSKLSELYANFDASYDKEKQENRYQILLGTDKISEGFNLNRAGMIINYDIPWNPVRVIQRLGRINRIGQKVFDELYIVNFFPTEKGADIVKSREIASNKMFLIHNVLGEDSKIFDVDEQPSPAKLYHKIQTNPDKLEEESFYTKIYKKFQEIKEKNPELISKLDSFPSRVKVARKSNENELLVFFRKGRLYNKRIVLNNKEKPESVPITLEEAFKKIECNSDEKRLELSKDFWDLYEYAKQEREIRLIPTSEQSLEQKAKITLKTMLYNSEDKRLLPFKNFLRNLLEDIEDYGTLPDYTLRRIANLDFSSEEKSNKSIKELEKLMDELGENYLEKEKRKIKNIRKEIIVAIENQKR